ncbi:hypothetical protein [Tardiphaga sp. OK246]|uniref:hypothetical protein n=1 Tax=Tardiphaga sp. OK246 TaxID=1855307 RepID=UPI001595E2D6|nr:hypothetical protein [Tardiphaga sp. OK246]
MDIAQALIELLSPRNHLCGEHDAQFLMKVPERVITAKSRSCAVIDLVYEQ